MDWTGCPDVESVPDRLSGAPVVKGTRVQADSVIEHFDDGFTAQEIVDLFPTLPLDRVERIIAHAREHAPSPA